MVDSLPVLERREPFKSGSFPIVRPKFVEVIERAIVIDERQVIDDFFRRARSAIFSPVTSDDGTRGECNPS